MKLESYVKVYDNIMPVETIGSFIKFTTKQKFNPCGIGKENVVDKNVRNVEAYSLVNWDCKSKTKIHWCNYFISQFKKYVQEYTYEFAKPFGTSVEGITTLDVLKYETGGFYTPHIDNFLRSPRALSCILLLNNDYEGGELQFFNPTTGKLTVKVETAAGRLIIWPSAFLYPHAVKPIKKGTRYSIVSWAS
jgi:Rps23 Pro-64 3,4-dihydroxylase Tpa1-like proline 4-hydroxylase|tara:strand:- start:3249 stop:3821 length:573 start_codon:yes stop_codon:yes gene_type:complete